MRTRVSKIRRLSTRQKNPRKKKSPKFQIGQGITIIGGVHSGKKGKILKITPKYAVVQVKRKIVVEVARRATTSFDASSKAQRHVFQQVFIKVGLQNVQLPTTKPPKATFKPKRLDAASRKQSKLQQCRTELKKLEKTRDRGGKKTDRRVTPKIVELRKKITKLHNELKTKRRKG